MFEYILLALFVVFIAKHFVCDFVLQFPYMLEQKGIYGAEGGLHHAAIHGIATSLIMVPFLDPIIAVIAGLADGVAHYHIDYFKQQITSHYTIEDKIYWWTLGCDQALHYVTYAVILGVFIV